MGSFVSLLACNNNTAVHPTVPIIAIIKIVIYYSFWQRKRNGNRLVGGNSNVEVESTIVRHKRVVFLTPNNYKGVCFSRLEFNFVWFKSIWVFKGAYGDCFGWRGGNNFGLDEGGGGVELDTVVGDETVGF